MLPLGPFGLLRFNEPPAISGAILKLCAVSKGCQEFLGHRAAGYEVAPGSSIRETLQHQAAILQSNDALHPRRPQRPCISVLPDVGVLSAGGRARQQQHRQEANGPTPIRHFSRPDGFFDLLHVSVFQLVGLRIRQFERVKGRNTTDSGSASNDQTMVGVTAYRERS